jgi:hypothetical protein
MPAARLAVLKELTNDDGRNTTKIAQGAGLHWNVTFRNLEDLSAIGVVDDLGITAKSIRRSRSRQPHGRLAVSSIGGSKNVSSGSVGYAVQTGGNAGSKLVIFVRPTAIDRYAVIARFQPGQSALYQGARLGSP